MKRYKGTFLYKVNGVLKQYSFRGALGRDVIRWRTGFMKNKSFNEQLFEDKHNTALHLGW